MVSVPTCPHCGLQVIPTRNICPSCRNDITDLRDAAAHLRQVRLRAVIDDLISAGKSRIVIQRFLVEELGLSQDQAEHQMTLANVHYEYASEIRGPRDLIAGMCFFLGGAVVTGFTLSTATLHGGFIVIAYGPVIWRGYRFLVGASRFLNSRRAVRLRRE